MPFPNVHPTIIKDSFVEKPIDGKDADDEIHYKVFPFVVTSTKEMQTDKGHYGIIKGYASTFGNIDRGGDVVVQGAFTKCLERYKELGRPIRMHWQHNYMELIGGFPADKAYEDEKGLFVEGHINLDVQRGREAYALAKQGVLSDMSIGFRIVEVERAKDGTYLLKEIDVMETSLVGEPMNTDAKITYVKARKTVDLPLADRSHSWDYEAALQRIKDFTGSDDTPSKSYENAFMWHDKKSNDEYDSYMLPYADVIDGQLKALPHALFAVAAVLKAARGTIKIPDVDKQKIISRINVYYEKMGIASPLKEYDNTIVYKDVNWISSKEHVDFLSKNLYISVNINDSRKINEEKLRNAGFSKKAANLLISIYKSGLGDPVQTVVDETEVFMCLERVSATLSAIASNLKSK